MESIGINLADFDASHLLLNKFFNLCKTEENGYHALFSRMFKCEKVSFLDCEGKKYVFSLNVDKRKYAIECTANIKFKSNGKVCEIKTYYTDRLDRDEKNIFTQYIVNDKNGRKTELNMYDKNLEDYSLNY